MHLLRTRFKQEIVAEYLPPLRSRKKTKALIICQGAPAVPYAKDLVEYFSKKGYWVFFPRYRGSWESGGVFLKKSPHLDVLDVIEGIEEGFMNLKTGEIERISLDEIHLIGSSFGGPAVLLSSPHPKVSKVVALSPVVDWLYGDNGASIEGMYRFSQIGFGEGYRFAKGIVEKMRKGDFYNPIAQKQHIASKKVHLFLTEDDAVVPSAPALSLARELSIPYSLTKVGGHLGVRALMENPKLLKKVEEFLR